MDTDGDAIEAFWKGYVETDPQGLEGEHYVDAFRFGNTPEMADDLASLVLKGTKTATSMLMLELELENRPLWKAGDKSIVLDGAGSPVCIIQTTRLEVQPFNTVDERFVYEYGEGDRSLDWWNSRMKPYYFDLTRQLQGEPSEDMLLICERFRVVFPATQ